MSSKIVVVNEKDDVIGFKERESLKSEEIYRVSALWITNNKGEILLARRAFSKSHDPGKWGPAVAGTIEEGETYESNIVKEAEEELGIKNIKFSKVDKVRGVFGEHNYFCQWYLANINKKLSEFKVRREEVAEIKWFSKQELLTEFKKNPDEFLTTMKQWIELFP